MQLQSLLYWKTDHSEDLFINIPIVPIIAIFYSPPTFKLKKKEKKLKIF